MKQEMKQGNRYRIPQERALTLTLCFAVVMILLCVQSCSKGSSKSNTLPYSWAVGSYKNEYVYWHFSDSASAVRRTDTVYNAMTVELRNMMLLTTTRLQGAQIIKSELLRRTPAGLMRILACDDGTLLEQVFLPFPKPDASAAQIPWAITACTGDTISTLRVQSTDTTITVPAGTFRVLHLREVDFTNLTTDFYFHDSLGLVQMTYQHSIMDSSRQRYVADPAAQPFEGFVLKKIGKRRG